MGVLSKQTYREGGKYEAIGFLVILAGIGACFVSGEAGSITIVSGFLVFLVGRFM